MAELKTRPTGASVTQFISAIADPVRRADCRTLASLMARVTGARAEMWGPSIVGFGRFRYERRSGEGLEWFLVGFSPRKQDLTVYVMVGIHENPALLARLGKYKKSGGGCLYLKGLADVDVSVLEALVERSATALRERGQSAALAVKAKKAVRPAPPKRAAAIARPKPARTPARAR
jgi:hypothetical protein